VELLIIVYLLKYGNHSRIQPVYCSIKRVIGNYLLGKAVINKASAKGRDLANNGNPRHYYYCYSASS
jgi:hypothetical protein